MDGRKILVTHIFTITFWNVNLETLNLAYGIGITSKTKMQTMFFIEKIKR